MKKHKNNNGDGKHFPVIGERKSAFHDIKRDHEPGVFDATHGASTAQALSTRQTHHPPLSSTPQEQYIPFTSRTVSIAKPIPLPPYFGTMSSKQASAHSGNQYPLTDRLRNLAVREPLGVNGKSRSHVGKNVYEFSATKPGGQRCVIKQLLYFHNFVNHSTKRILSRSILQKRIRQLTDRRTSLRCIFYHFFPFLHSDHGYKLESTHNSISSHAHTLPPSIGSNLASHRQSTSDAFPEARSGSSPHLSISPHISPKDVTSSRSEEEIGSDLSVGNHSDHASTDSGKSSPTRLSASEMVVATTPPPPCSTADMGFPLNSEPLPIAHSPDCLCGACCLARRTHLRQRFHLSSETDSGCEGSPPCKMFIDDRGGSNSPSSSRYPHQPTDLSSSSSSSSSPQRIHHALEKAKNGETTPFVKMSQTTNMPSESFEYVNAFLASIPLPPNNSGYLSSFSSHHNFSFSQYIPYHPFHPASMAIPPSAHSTPNYQTSPTQLKTQPQPRSDAAVERTECVNNTPRPTPTKGSAQPFKATTLFRPYLLDSSTEFKAREKNLTTPSGKRAASPIDTRTRDTAAGVGGPERQTSNSHREPSSHSSSASPHDSRTPSPTSVADNTTTTPVPKRPIIVAETTIRNQKDRRRLWLQQQETKMAGY